MNALLLAAAILAYGVNADVAGSAQSVASVANDVTPKITGWKSGDGLQGALDIQGGFPALSSAINGYASALNDIQPSDIDVEAVNTASASISKLLDALSSKAADFAAVNAEGIAANDLKTLAGPAQTIVDDLINAAGSDGAKWGSISSGVDDLKVKVNDANKAYSLPTIDFAADPTGSTSTASTQSSSSAESSSSSSASSSVESTTKSGTSSPTGSASTTSSGAVRNTTATTAHSTTQHGGSVPSGSKNSTKSNPPPPHNGGVTLVAGIGAAAVGAAALLL